MMATHVLTIENWRPHSLNELTRGKLYDRVCLSAADKATVGWEALRLEIPKATGKRRVIVNFIYPPRKRFHDADAFHKSLLDSLKACGLLVGDSPKWVELPPWRFGRGTKQTTVIMLEDLES